MCTFTDQQFFSDPQLVAEEKSLELIDSPRRPIQGTDLLLAHVAVPYGYQLVQPHVLIDRQVVWAHNFKV